VASRGPWNAVLLVLVGANVAGGIVFVLAEMLVPSFVVYPIFLLLGSARLARGRGTTGVVFLAVTALVFILVHLPYTRFGPEGSACEDCSPAVMWITLFVLPVSLLAAAVAAWRDLRGTAAAASGHGASPSA
jgi:hypothetical protein